MLDSRFPFLCRIADATNLSPERYDLAVKFVANVERRVPGAHACYNRKTGNLFFYFGPEPNGGPFCIPIAAPADGHWPLDQRDEDDAVAVLGLAQRPWDEREKAEQEKKQAEAKTKAAAEEKQRAERRPEIQRHADFLDRKRRGVSKVIAEAGFAPTANGLLVPHDKES